tara:strand:+ start:430 stop:747 length:318 start_codon:yes stop_codon:yes gene_type:complete
MINLRKITFLIIIFFLVSGCSTLKKGFQPDKRSGEEFLVEKKSPLVMPPSYDKLPIPNEKKIEEKDRKSEVISLLTGSKNQESTDFNKENISSIEKLILKEIKKN